MCPAVHGSHPQHSSKTPFFQHHSLPGGGLGESVGLAVGDASVGVVQESVDGRGGQGFGHDLVEPGRVQVRGSASERFS